MPTVTVKFTDPSVVDVKVLQIRSKKKKPAKSHYRILQLHDAVYDPATDEWAATFPFVNPGAKRLVLRVLGLDRAQKVVASVTLPPRKFPK